MTSDTTNNLICVAEIMGVHGVRGLLKLKSYAEDPNILINDRVLYTENKKNKFIIDHLAPHKKGYLARIKGVDDRNRAEELIKTKLYIERSELPEIDDEEFYFVDLVGLTARLENGQDIGIIKSVQNFGAGDLLEISAKNHEISFIPFTKENTPEIKLSEGYVTVVPPNYTVDTEE